MTQNEIIEGSLPSGEPARARVQVTRAHALVLLKLLAMDERYRNLRGVAHRAHDRQEARTHADDIVAVMSAQTDLDEFRKRFARQFAEEIGLKERTKEIIKAYFADESRPGVILYEESLVSSLPPGETVRELKGELRRAQRYVASLLLD